jgi:ATP-dependent protease HslVU (ClpYQ) peptidase subunit
MTCIVAVTDGRRVVVGGDSAASSVPAIEVLSTEKVFTVGPYAIGFTRSYRMGQLLRHRIELPEPPQTEDLEALERFMVTDFVEAVREGFEELGFGSHLQQKITEKHTTQGQRVGGVFVVGVAGQLFSVREEYQVIRPQHPFTAVGAGAGIALGSLHALASTNTSLRERAELALRASEAYSAIVRGPFHFVEV